MTLWIVVGSALLVGAGLGALAMSWHLMRELRAWRRWNEEIQFVIRVYQAQLDLQYDEAVRAYEGHPQGLRPDLGAARQALNDLKAPPAPPPRSLN